MFNLTSAGLCFLSAAVGFAGVAAFIQQVADSRTWDATVLGQLAIVVALAAGATTFIYLGLFIASDVLPRERPRARVLRYAAVMGIALALAIIALPLMPITFVAMLLVRLFGRPIGWAITRRCPDCALARRAMVATSRYCPRHGRLFGDPMYQALLSDDD